VPVPLPVPVPEDRDELATVTRAATKPPGPGRAASRLRAVHPPTLTWQAQLATHPVILGRTTSTEGAPALAHATVSRRHYEITWDERAGHHVGRDLGSHNGTRCDAALVGTTPHALHDGSVLQLGDVTLILERGEPGDDVALAATEILGASPAAGRLRAAIVRAAPDPSPVLLVGETGTGKEFVAREVHRLSGRTGPLVAINCSALSAQIVDSQLFGHQKGAFTGATSDHPGLFRAAHGGTLFLDEIGEMPLELQPKLLRALQEGAVQPVGSTRPVAVDVRVVAATNRRLDEAIESGAFRRDLYARLALWEIAVPPLRERRGDLLAWLSRLHEAFDARRSTHAPTPIDLSPDAVEAVLLHPWPSNLRELDRLVHELAATHAGASIAADALPPWISREPARAPEIEATGTRAAATPPPSGKRPVPTREQFEAAFEALGGNVRALAKHFDRDRRQIYRWIETWGLADRRGPS
jgi:transcriptional regulator with GAF, ATPase, and Fis domain